MAEINEAPRNAGEREFEIGKDEAWFANVKRTYDEYQHESLESIKRNRSYVDKVLGDAQQNDNTRQNIANQALQNAVETANMVGKQAVRHSDIAIDRQWNVDEQGYTAQKILAAMQDPAIIAAMAAAIAKTMTDMAGSK
jgi:hypothetical protein